MESAETTEQELRQHLESEQARILFALSMGRSKTILVTFDGLRVPSACYFTVPPCTAILIAREACYA
ncbi:hypothetical protein HPB48_011037 [Haemaphysalis longicornis]|uniref:Uncharacterized protein n=1 Tax=Haemaphysalis longicornis TaxID=44386 RepID=A0A9J6GQU3_HAELO|nr:hypothetical protein HPB48_011037 [Haemaphysalis longicornis]